MAVVTELTIDGTGATRGAEEYSRAMDRAQQAMHRGMGAISDDATRTRDSIASLGGALTGLVSGGIIAGAVTMFSKLTQEIASFETTARRAGLALDQFQALRGAAALKGIGGGDFDTSIQKMAKALNEARREETDLSKLLDVNNVKFKEGTNLVIDTNRALEIAANLIRRASSEQDKIKIAKAFGLDEDFVNLLQGGAGALRELSDQARQSGAVISDQIIQRAAEFDREWTRVTASWSLRLKAAAIDAAQGIKDALQQAQDTQLGGIPLLPKNIGIGATIDALKADWSVFTGDLSQKWQSFISVLEKVPGLEGLRSELGTIPPLITNLISDADRLRAAFTDVQKMSSSVPTPRDRPAGAPGATIIPVDETKSAFDRQIDSIHKHIAAMKADAESMGLGVAAHEAFRVQLQLEEAASRDSIGLTKERMKAIADEVQAVREAAQAKEQARVTSQIKFEKDTLFLSPADRQIAQQLRGLYDDVGKSLNSAEAAQLRFLNTIKEIKDLAGDFVKSFVSGLIQGKSAMQALGDAALSLGQKLASSAVDDLLSGNFVQAGVKGAAAAIAIVFGKGQAERAKREEEQRRREEESKQRIDALQQRRLLAGLDTGTQVGALTAFDLSANQQRQQAGREGLLSLENGKVVNKELILLEQTLAVEREAIIKKFADDAIAQEKRRADEVKQINQDLADREFAAGNDNSTQQGRLLEFDRATLRERQRLEKDFAELIPQLDKTRLAEREALERQFADAARQRQQGFRDSLFLLVQDQTTLEGQLAAFELQAQRQRQDEIKSGGEAIVELQALQEQQRLNIIKDFNDKAIEEQKRVVEEANNFFTQLRRNIREFIDGLRAGASSPLSPAARLAAAQAQYNQQLALAQGGNRDALSGITRYGSDLIEASRAYFGSGGPFQTTFNQVIAQLEALPTIAQSADPVVAAIEDTTEAINAQTAITQLIKISNQAVADQALATKNLVTTGNELQTTSNTISDAQKVIAGDQKALLETIKGILNAINDATAQSVINTNAITGNVAAQIPFHRATAWNTARHAQSSSNVAGARWGFEQLGGGGIIPPFGLALVSEHAPGGGRFLRAGPEPITVTPNAPSNDNGPGIQGLASAIRAMHADVARLLAAIANTSARGDAMLAGAIQQSGRRQENKARHQSEKPKAA